MRRGRRVRLRWLAEGGRFGVRAVSGLAIGMAACALSAPAEASLGGPYQSVQSDRLHFAARMSTATRSDYTVHTLALANGGEVHEYVNAAGDVFAVTWKGPGRPDLQQLLGDRFQAVQADNVRSGPRLKRPLTVLRSDFRMHTGGHPGAFWGQAYLPAQAPAGFTGSDLK